VGHDELHLPEHCEDVLYGGLYHGEQEGVGHDELHQLELCEDVLSVALCHREQQGVLHDGLHQHEHYEERVRCVNKAPLLLHQQGEL
jgi:hypothetical protein